MNACDTSRVLEWNIASIRVAIAVLSAISSLWTRTVIKHVAESLQSTALRTVANAAQCLSSGSLRKQPIRLPTIQEEIKRNGTKREKRVAQRPNQLTLQAHKAKIKRRSKNKRPSDLLISWDDARWHVSFLGIVIQVIIYKEYGRIHRMSNRTNCGEK